MGPVSYTHLDVYKRQCMHTTLQHIGFHWNNRETRSMFCNIVTILHPVFTSSHVYCSDNLKNKLIPNYETNIGTVT